MANEENIKPHQFKPGQSGNPKGRPKVEGSRTGCAKSWKKTTARRLTNSLRPQCGKPKRVTSASGTRSLTGWKARSLIAFSTLAMAAGQSKSTSSEALTPERRETMTYSLELPRWASISLWMIRRGCLLTAVVVLRRPPTCVWVRISARRRRAELSSCAARS